MTPEQEKEWNAECMADWPRVAMANSTPSEAHSEGFFAACEFMQAKIDALTARAEAAEKKYKYADTSNRCALNMVDARDSQITELRAKVVDLEREIGFANDRHKDAETRVVGLRAKVEDLQNRSQELEDLCRSTAEKAYKNGDVAKEAIVKLNEAYTAHAKSEARVREL